jgi:hypothetical protein
MICECNFFESKIPGHIDYRTLEQHVDELQANRIVLNHLGEEMLARLEQVGLTCAQDGMQVTV